MRILLFGIFIVLSVAAGIVLLQRFRATRNLGYAVLAAGIGLWPLVDWAAAALVSTLVQRRVRSGQSPRDFSETVVVISSLPRLLQMAVILIGILLAFKKTAATNEPPNSQQQPTTGPSARGG
jgi:hypothetical protein